MYCTLVGVTDSVSMNVLSAISQTSVTVPSVSVCLSLYLATDYNQECHLVLCLISVKLCFLMYLKCTN